MARTCLAVGLNTGATATGSNRDTATGTAMVPTGGLKDGIPSFLKFMTATLFKAVKRETKSFLTLATWHKTLSAKIFCQLIMSAHLISGRINSQHQQSGSLVLPPMLLVRSMQILHQTMQIYLSFCMIMLNLNDYYYL